MSGMMPEITADMVAKRLSRVVVDHGDEVTPAELAYREAAAVLASFVPSELRPVGGEEDAKALAALLRICEPVYGPTGRQEWRLPDALRRETLKRFHSEEALRQAVTANPVEGGPVQRMLSAYATRSAPPLDAQPYEDLLATAQVTAWLRGIVPETPDPQEVRDQLAIAETLAPLRRLVGSSFRGRTDVLERLHDYADILPPDSRVRAIRRHLRRFASLGENPPLVLHGPGGVGKSTVLAKFMLDHADADHRVPFTYIDFDRPDMLPQEPLSLLLEALRQLGAQYRAVRARAEALRAIWLERLSQPNFRLLASAVIDPPTQLAERSPEVPESIKLRADVPTRELFYGEFADLVRAISTDKPLLFCLDTFESVQRYGVDIVDEVWQFLDGLLRELPSLRVVIAGRAPMDGYSTQPVLLSGFDEESARGFLASLLGPELGADSELVDHIVRVVGRNPLSLRLAADLVVNHGTHELDDIDRRRALFVRLRGEQIQGWLYRRILDRIADPDVRALAHPGLVVRRLTPDVIRYVLAGPCNVEVPDDARARELFDACSREVSLLSWATDGSLEHRADVRREMLPLLRRDDPERVADIHRAAVSYYQRHGDITSRAEELYHRLCLHEPAESLDRRWQRGVENFLVMSLEELPSEGQVYLASRLGITLPAEIRHKARLLEQERYTATRVRQLLRLGELDKALDALAEQSDRTHNSPLDILEAQVFEELGRLDEASAVLDQASQRAAEAGDDATLVELQYSAARLAERQGRTERALELLAAARAAMLEPRDPLMPLRLWTAELRVRRVTGAPAQDEAGRPDPPEVQKARGELLRLLDATPTEQIAKDPALLAELVGEVGQQRPDLVTQALLVIGMPRVTGARVGELASALAEWDARNDHQVALRLRLPEGPESTTGPWAEWLRSTPATVVTQALVAVLATYPDGALPVTALLSILYRESLASASTRS
jgi:cellulose synthase operon protein C